MRWSRLGVALGSVAAAGAGASYYRRSQSRAARRSFEAGTSLSPPNFKIATREEQISALQDRSRRFDVLVVGGGATGTGVALDAATRGLSVALVEQNDFSSGTSSRSTKLIHGGVRYLEKAFRNLDREQYDMVIEALHERANLLKIAPHMSYELPIMLPVYSWLSLPYYWAGAKAYDFLSGKQALESSYFLTKSKALERFPHLKQDSLKGAIVYYDGAHNDARMNVSIALTAMLEGALVVNHVRVTALRKDEESGDVTGARVEDCLTGEQWDVDARVVVNATGPFTDGVRKMDDAEAADIVSPSSGVHVVLPDYYSPKDMGLLDPATEDGRVIFFLPWQGSVVAGTTDTPTEVTTSPQAREQEIRFILHEVSSYLSKDIQVRREDVLASWAGIRPLVRDPRKANTEALARNHIVTVSESGLVTVAGGKWTTYRRMAFDTMEEVLSRFSGRLHPTSACRTEEVRLIGAHAFSPNLKIALIQEYGLESSVADHLVHSYGDRARLVADLAEETGPHWPKRGRRLCDGYPYLVAEIRYAVKYEMARTVEDVLARRTRMAFLNARAALGVAPKVAAVMAEELGWDAARVAAELVATELFLQGMGLSGGQEEGTFDFHKMGSTPKEAERSGGGV